nr:MAG TPA: hypothetical protein [Caudoviricetes sp.]
MLFYRVRASRAPPVADEANRASGRGQNFQRPP